MNTKTPAFEELWLSCSIDPNRVLEVKSAVKKICNNAAAYNSVMLATGVPWQLVAALHYRESSFRFDTCLHNGDPLGAVTVHAPKGRGPFVTWEEAAIDALKYDGLHLVGYPRISSMLVMAERYNGLGYRKTNELSPYIWAGTNHHDETGKFTSDSKYNPDAREKQLGVAAILKGLTTPGFG